MTDANHGPGRQAAQIDPVCGEPLTEEETVATCEHRGRQYAFKHIKCKMLFEREPEKYVNEAGEPTFERPSLGEPPAVDPVAVSPPERSAGAGRLVVAVAAVAGMAIVIAIGVTLTGGYDAEVPVGGSVGGPENGGAGGAAPIAPTVKLAPRSLAEALAVERFAHTAMGEARYLTSYPPLAEDPAHPDADGRLAADWQAKLVFENGAVVVIKGVYVDYLGRLEKEHGATVFFANRALIVVPAAVGWQAVFLVAPVAQHGEPLRGFAFTIDTDDPERAQSIAEAAMVSARVSAAAPAGSTTISAEELSHYGLTTDLVFRNDAIEREVLRPGVAGGEINRLFEKVNDDTRDILK